MERISAEQGQTRRASWTSYLDYVMRHVNLTSGSLLPHTVQTAAVILE